MRRPTLLNDILAKTVGISQLDYALFPDVEELHSTYRFYDAVHQRELSDVLEIHSIERVKIKEDKPHALRTPFERWLHFLPDDNGLVLGLLYDRLPAFGTDSAPRFLRGFRPWLGDFVRHVHGTMVQGRKSDVVSFQAMAYAGPGPAYMPPQARHRGSSSVRRLADQILVGNGQVEGAHAPDRTWLRGQPSLSRRVGPIRRTGRIQFHRWNAECRGCDGCRSVNHLLGTEAQFSESRSTSAAPPGGRASPGEIQDLSRTLKDTR